MRMPVRVNRLLSVEEYLQKLVLNQAAVGHL